ncbi:MAG: 4Fe-4S dicluster domain-containing protein [Planctomycetes bacterium]|nr:4Fe-4S dicluster domain-containing protein [Planctomycetota bacterium]
MNDARHRTDEPPAETSSTDNRRAFLKAAALLGGAAAAGTAALVHAKRTTVGNEPTGAASVRELPPLKSIAIERRSDPLLRMQEALRRALAKPVEERRWLMVIDTRKCVGCHACTIACVAENRLPPGVVYRPVVTEELGVFPNVALRFTPRPCMHCDQPPCTPVCPVKATWKRPDGIVVIDYDKCIGCGYCVTACPYNARTRNLGEYYTDGTPARQPYESRPSFEYGKLWDREGHRSPVGNARKCHFCLHRLEEGMLPECVTSCIGRATFFGDAADPDALVAELCARPNARRLLEEKGTAPRVVYLV